jgi:hypothetical protein
MGEVAQKAVTGIDKALDRMDEQMAPIQRDATFEQRRDQESRDSYSHGPDGADAIDVQDGLANWANLDDPEVMNHYGERSFTKGSENAKPGELEHRLASHEISNHYMINSAEEYDKVKDKMLPEDTPLDLSSQNARLKTLDNLVQNRPDMKDGENTCAASSLLAGAILSGGKNGTEGVTTLLDSVAKQCPDEETRKAFEANLGQIREKIAKGEPLTVGDMHSMQNNIYTQLNFKEQQGNAQDLPGLQADTLQKFLDASPELKKKFKDNGLAVSYIDNNGKTPSTHAVLSIARDGQNPAIYDPYLRDDGQLVTGDQQTAGYEEARKRTLVNGQLEKMPLVQ